MKNDNVTIYDIAREAGVSPATVSRIINGTANVKAEKRERVQAVMDKHIFVPNALAKGLSSRESKTICVLLSDIRNPFYSSVYLGLETAAVKYGYNAVLCNALNDEEVEKQQLEMMSSRRVDLIVICGGRTDTVTPDDNQIAFMNQIAERVPIVVAGTADYFPCSTIRIDNRPAMEALMGYLIGLGHRDFALIGGLAANTPTSEKRGLFRNILHREGLTCNEKWIIETPSYEIADGYEAAKKLFRSPNPPTAILGINEFVALGIMQAAADAGLNVPHDISVAGFDNTFLAKLPTPTLTSAGCMYDEYGEVLMELIRKVIANPQERLLSMVPSGLTVRKSCAAPRQNGMRVD